MGKTAPTEGCKFRLNLSLAIRRIEIHRKDKLFSRLEEEVLITHIIVDVKYDPVSATTAAAGS